MTDKQFPEGFRVFKPHEKAPEFVKCEIEIEVEKLIDWLDDKGEKVKLTVKQSQKGSYYAEVNTYQPKVKEPEGDAGDLPF